jgi:hypothetical protein
MINYDDFQHVNFVFWQIFISLFWGLFDDGTDLRVRIELKSTSVGSTKEGETLEFTRRKETTCQGTLWKCQKAGAYPMGTLMSK